MLNCGCLPERSEWICWGMLLSGHRREEWWTLNFWTLNIELLNFNKPSVYVIMLGCNCITPAAGFCSFLLVSRRDRDLRQKRTKKRHSRFYRDRLTIPAWVRRQAGITAPLSEVAMWSRCAWWWRAGVPWCGAGIGVLNYELWIMSFECLVRSWILREEFWVINAEKLAMLNCGCLPERSEWICWGMLLSGHRREE